MVSGSSRHHAIVKIRLLPRMLPRFVGPWRRARAATRMSTPSRWARCPRALSDQQGVLIAQVVQYIVRG